MVYGLPRLTHKSQVTAEGSGFPLAGRWGSVSILPLMLNMPYFKIILN
uniref:Uncharacterized protein n=1 Tax=Anguilla anguilla TaxID=7936 RepID=A0A0E9WHM6_ANGAN